MTSRAKKMQKIKARAKAKMKNCPWSVRVVTSKTWKPLACFKTKKTALANAKSRAGKSRIKPGYGGPTFLVMHGGGRHHKVFKLTDGSTQVQNV